MKIGILTQPLGHNYGGILQNWALQQVLIKHGHDPITLTYTGFPAYAPKQSVFKRIRQYIYVLLSYLFKIILRHPNLPISNLPWQHKPYDNLLRFVKKNIRSTRILRKIDCDTLESLGIDTIICGSDQVWRPIYNPGGVLDLMYCSFIHDSHKISAITYAASFGSSEWEYTTEQTSIYRGYVSNFRSISVREQSGVTLCENYYGIIAKHVLDPTLLLCADEYRMLYKKHKQQNYSDMNGCIAVYILDPNPLIYNLVQQVCNYFNKTPIYIGKPNKKNYELPPIENWLRTIDESFAVITDSFHGSVFSVIFEKQFVSLLNSSRGNDRFHSFLQPLCLTNICVSNYDVFKCVEILKQHNDWDIVRKKLKFAQEASIDFLKSNI